MQVKRDTDIASRAMKRQVKVMICVESSCHMSPEAIRLRYARTWMTIGGRLAALSMDSPRQHCQNLEVLRLLVTREKCSLLNLRWL